MTNPSELSPTPSEGDATINTLPRFKLSDFIPPDPPAEELHGPVRWLLEILRFSLGLTLAALGLFTHTAPAATTKKDQS